MRKPCVVCVGCGFTLSERKTKVQNLSEFTEFVVASGLILGDDERCSQIRLQDAKIVVDNLQLA